MILMVQALDHTKHRIAQSRIHAVNIFVQLAKNASQMSLSFLSQVNCSKAAESRLPGALTEL
jgi:hypothetical protein